MRYVRSILATGQRHGIDSDRLLAPVKIDEALLAAPKARIGIKQFSRLYAIAAMLLDDETVGLAGGPTRQGSAELMCRACLSAGTIGDAVEILARGWCVTQGSLEARGVISDQGAELRWSERLPVLPDRALFYEVTVLTAFAILSWLAGSQRLAVEVDFPFSSPRHLFELRSLLPGPLRFRQPRACLRLASSSTSLPVVRDSREVTRFVRQAPGSFIECIVARSPVSTKVRGLLFAALPDVLSLDDVATRFAWSRRTLHRRLFEEGESFQSIRDRLRLDLAIQALTRTSRPIKQIAAELGFSDQTAFQRAFTHLTGGPPGAHRRSVSALRG